MGTRALALVMEAMKRRRLYPGEPLDLELPKGEPDQELDQLTRIRAEVAEIAAACRAVMGDVEDAIIANLGHLGRARLGPDFYSVHPAENFKIKETERSRFFRWVHAHQIADRLFNPNQARKGSNQESGLRLMATLPDPDTGEIMSWPEFRDTFFDRAELDRLELTVIPVDRPTTAKWIKKLSDGYIDRRNPEREDLEHDDAAADP